jgi:hypothetical protein
VPERNPVRLALMSAGALCGGVLAAASVVVLHGPTMLLVAVAAVSAAGAAAFTTDMERPAATAAVAWKAAAITVAAIVLVSGLAVLAGGAVAAVGGLGSAVVVAGVLLLRARSRSGTRTQRQGSQRPGSDRPAVPVAQLPTSALASEWRWTTGELAVRVDPRTRQAIVRRREETLDELERRDPIGFARWLAVGAPPASDPAEFVHDDRGPGTDVFGGQP